MFGDFRRLGSCTNVLYLAAHPDDENTRLIAYLSKFADVDVSYLSLTRGDGGQNLIGPEIGADLGIIRTQELLAARRVDGGRQFFSRAIDFGYSKTAEETLAIWNQEEVLSDVVRVIRMVRPAVIVCRFPTDGRGGHGHHTSSALLGQQAFHLAADPEAFPEQIDEGLMPWQASRIVVNTGRWWSPDINEETPGVVAMDVGRYDENLGQSATEIAAEARTMHKSQGFGSTGARGAQMEYFEHLDGVEAEKELLFDCWADVRSLQGGQGAANHLATLRRQWSWEAPSRNVPGLLRVRRQLEELVDPFWRQRKLQQVDDLIRQCMGLYLEVVVDRPLVVPGETLTANLEVVARGMTPAQWSGLTLPGYGAVERQPLDVAFNRLAQETVEIQVPMDAALSQPFWLAAEPSQGLYTVEDSRWIGLPENPAALTVGFDIDVMDTVLHFDVPVVNKWNDPVKGELYRPLAIVPPVLVSLGDDGLVFAGPGSRDLEVRVRGMEAGFGGQVVLTAPAGWTLEPSTWPVAFEGRDEESVHTVRITAGADAQSGALAAAVQRENAIYDRSLRELAYDHIPTQVWFPKAQARLTYVDLKRAGQRIGYLPGAGDTVAEALRDVGYEVVELHAGDLVPEVLDSLDTVVTGIRFLNVEEQAGEMMAPLLQWCERGGTLVLQYNTAHALKTERFAPFAMHLSRDRVTEEDAVVQLLAPEHPVLNTPNKIGPADFEGWVQERGLYFADQWGPEFTPILRWHDQGESDKDGALLVAPYGKGHFVYTSVSFFRQLPAGVPGAYRLLVNLLSWGAGE
ncbi:MAG: PIG-L family deacetylase [Planctomycetota bacterium]